MHQLLQQHFGFSEFRPGQLDVINALVNKGAALAVFPTGGGKSLCYQLPALVFEGVTVVVSPLIALMKDQIDFLRAHGIAASRLDSSLSADEAREVGEQVRTGELRLLYVAPERFNNERFLALMKAANISLFAVDEAHCISEWGHNFRPDYLKIAEIAREIAAERVLALTATATPEVAADIRKAFGIDDDAAIVTGFYRHNLFLETTPVTSSERDSILAERLGSRVAGPTIVYVTLQKTAERVGDGASRRGIRGKGLSCRYGIRREARCPGLVDAVEDAHRGRHHRVRNGNRQGRCALCLSLQPAQKPRELQPGDRTGGTRRSNLDCRASGLP